MSKTNEIILTCDPACNLSGLIWKACSFSFFNGCDVILEHKNHSYRLDYEKIRDFINGLITPEKEHGMSVLWLNPEGRLIDAGTEHIQEIISDPVRYDLTKRKIASIYKKHNEEPWFEGTAREEILICVMRKGWIRIRYAPRKYQITMQLSTEYYKKGSWKTPVKVWCVRAMREKLFPATSDVRVLNLAGETLDTGDMRLYEIASGSLKGARR